MKIIYIAHPISGDIKSNVDKIISIIRQINLTMPDVVPFAPYLPDIWALNDNVPEERERGIKNDHELLNRGFVDEMWLYGSKISQGMKSEIQLARKLNIRILAKTQETEKMLLQIMKLKN